VNQGNQPPETDKPFEGPFGASAVYPAPAITPTSVPSEMPFFNPDVSIRGASFDQILQQRGIRMIHEKATPCPNILTVDSNAHEPNCPFCDNNGFLHYGKEEIWGVFSGNSIQKTFEAHGVWEIGSAVITLPTHYPDGITPADFNSFDKLTLPDFMVRLWELKEYEPRPGNIQELRYPIKKVEYVSTISRDGKTLKQFQEGVDFNINSDGDIAWVAGKTPDYDPNTEHGEVLTWSFQSNPVYLVVQCLRELRITQEMVGGQKTPRKLPQQILVKRDFLPTASETVVKP
jgi:hypothetical protein